MIWDSHDFPVEYLPNSHIIYICFWMSQLGLLMVLNIFHLKSIVKFSTLGILKSLCLYSWFPLWYCIFSIVGIIFLFALLLYTTPAYFHPFIDLYGPYFFCSCLLKPILLNTAQYCWRKHIYRFRKSQSYYSRPGNHHQHWLICKLQKLYCKSDWVQLNSCNLWQV